MGDCEVKYFSDFLVFLVVVIVLLSCIGTPDIIDGVIYKLTGVKNWEVVK